jgi:DNA-binding response OmpR family regulator
MHCLYREYLNEYLKCLGLEVLVVENGSKCIEYFLESNDKGGFDMVILDSHFCDINWVEVIKQIRKKMLNQRIVFTTTYSLNQISNIIESLGIDKRDILLKSFYFTQLLSIVNLLITIK